MKTLEFGKREIMLVAHKVAKRCKQSFRESLRDAWRWYKSGSADFFSFLGLSIKEKRKNNLNSFDIKGFVSSMRGCTHTTVSFQGWIWDNKYNSLFKC